MAEAQHLGLAIDAPDAAVVAHEGGRARARPLEDADVREDRAHRRVVERLVLRGERVDVRREHVGAFAVQPRGGIRGAREDGDGDILQVRAEEGPAAVDLRVVAFIADVAAPGDVRAASEEVRDEAGRLRIVAYDHVALADERVHGDGVLLRHGVEDGALVGPERRAVAGRGAERVVDALGHAEEVGRSLEDEPADVDAEAADVAQDRAQHLGHAAAGRGGVDVPDGASAEERADRLRLLRE